MIKLTEDLEKLFPIEPSLINLSNILQDEEYIDDNLYPLKCIHCGAKNIKVHHKVQFSEVEEEYKKQILEIYPHFSENILTFWLCEDCGEIICIKTYTNINSQEKRVFYSKFDIRDFVLKYLKQQHYVNEKNEPLSCFYCDSDEIEIIQQEESSLSKCKTCGKTLAFCINDIWNLNFNG